MYIGKYYHKLEEKGRVSLPKSFRSKDKDWVVTRGFDGGLAVYTKTRFEQMLLKLQDVSFTKKKNRDLTRLMTNEAVEVKTDASGRVQLPEYLTQLAGLNKNLVVVGSYNHIEIWNLDRYHSYVQKLEPSIEDIAETYHDQE